MIFKYQQHHNEIYTKTTLSQHSNKTFNMRTILTQKWSFTIRVKAILLSKAINYVVSVICVMVDPGVSHITENTDLESTWRRKMTGGDLCWIWLGAATQSAKMCILAVFYPPPPPLRGAVYTIIFVHGTACRPIHWSGHWFLVIRSLLNYLFVYVVC